MNRLIVGPPYPAKGEMTIRVLRPRTLRAIYDGSRWAVSEMTGPKRP